MATCYLVGAGEFTARGLSPARGDLVIAADGGYTALAALGIQPDLLVGDFDSLATRPAGVPTLAFPVAKDDTDMGLAIREGLKRGYRDFALYGAGGGRIDHFWANLQLLGGLSAHGAAARMVCPAFDVLAVTDGTIVLPPRPAGTVASVFCHGAKATGVTLTGLRYPLLNATLTCDHPLGVSNVCLGGEASVTALRGTLLVFVAL
jgi:thiamine pyrophosphokinase